jgi:hypothetical protein
MRMSAVFLPLACQSGAFSPALWFVGFVSEDNFRQNLQNLKNSRAVTCFGNAPFCERDFRSWRRLGTGVAYFALIKNNPAVGIELTNLGEGVSLGRLGCFFILLPTPIHSWRHRESPPLGEPVSGE